MEIGVVDRRRRRVRFRDDERENHNQNAPSATMNTSNFNSSTPRGSVDAPSASAAVTLSKYLRSTTKRAPSPLGPTDRCSLHQTSSSGECHRETAVLGSRCSHVVNSSDVVAAPGLCSPRSRVMAKISPPRLPAPSRYLAPLQRDMATRGKCPISPSSLVGLTAEQQLRRTIREAKYIRESRLLASTPLQPRIPESLTEDDTDTGAAVFQQDAVPIPHAKPEKPQLISTASRATGHSVQVDLPAASPVSIAVQASAAAATIQRAWRSWKHQPARSFMVEHDADSREEQQITALQENDQHTSLAHEATLESPVHRHDRVVPQPPPGLVTEVTVLPPATNHGIDQGSAQEFGDTGRHGGGGDSIASQLWVDDELSFLEEGRCVSTSLAISMDQLQVVDSTASSRPQPGHSSPVKEIHSHEEPMATEILKAPLSPFEKSEKHPSHPASGTKKVSVRVLRRRRERSVRPYFNVRLKQRKRRQAVTIARDTVPGHAAQEGESSTRRLDLEDANEQPNRAHAVDHDVLHHHSDATGDVDAVTIRQCEDPEPEIEVIPHAAVADAVTAEPAHDAEPSTEDTARPMNGTTQGAQTPPLLLCDSPTQEHPRPQSRSHVFLSSSSQLLAPAVVVFPSLHQVDAELRRTIQRIQSQWRLDLRGSTSSASSSSMASPASSPLLAQSRHTRHTREDHDPIHLGGATSATLNPAKQQEFLAALGDFQRSLQASMSSSGGLPSARDDDSSDDSGSSHEDAIDAELQTMLNEIQRCKASIALARGSAVFTRRRSEDPLRLRWNPSAPLPAVEARSATWLAPDETQIRWRRDQSGLVDGDIF